MFLKKRMREPLLKAPYFFSIENMPRFLIERYRLHRNARYFSILLYFLNVQVAPTENKTDDDGSV
jgi:hypothetical protein